MQTFYGRTSRLLIVVGLMLSSPWVHSADCLSKRIEAFPEFFSRFSSDKSFAVSRTVYPLRTLLWEVGLNDKLEDDSSAKLKLISRVEDSKYPSLGQHMNNNGLVADVDIKTGLAEVHVFKPDTDWSVIYRFSIKKHCWYLHEIEDYSL